MTYILTNTHTHTLVIWGSYNDLHPGDTPHNVHASYIPHTYILPGSAAVSYHRRGKRQAYTTTIAHLTDLPLGRHGNPEESLFFQESHDQFHFAIMLHTLLENMELRNTYIPSILFWITVRPSAPSSLTVFVLNPTI